VGRWLTLIAASVLRVWLRSLRLRLLRSRLLRLRALARVRGLRVHRKH
jgi:hypothetical protein